MARIKTPSVPLEKETLPEHMRPIDSEEIQCNEEEANEETQVMQPLQMFFSPTEYTKPFKISAKCYIHDVVNMLESHLSKDELTWFKEHPQFRYFFHMHTESNHKLMGMWMLFLRMARLEKKKECWFIVNGVPIRYLLREFGLISGLDCQQYPNHYEGLGSMSFVGKYFKTGSVVTYAAVEEKFTSMKKSSSTDRLKMAVIYFLSSIIIGKKKTGKNAPSVEPFFLRAVDDLELCKTFPWGRLAFDENMKYIFHQMDHYKGVVGAPWIFHSFVMPLELLAFETIPVLMNKYREPLRDADPECPRMCKMKFTASTMKGIPLSELYDTLGETKDIQSIMVPNPGEEVLLARIMEEEGRWNDEDDAIADGWSRRLINEKMPIWFEAKYNEDVASREVVANPDMTSATARVPRINFGRENVFSKKVTKDGLVEMVYGLKQALEDGLKEIHEKFDEKFESLDRRVKSLTEYVNVQREKEKRFENDEENDEENETEEAEENESEEAGEKEKGIEEDGEKEKEMAGEKEMEEAGEDGGKTLKKYERKKRGKEQGEPSEGGGQRRKVTVRSPVMTRQKTKV